MREDILRQPYRNLLKIKQSLPHESTCPNYTSPNSLIEDATVRIDFKIFG